MELTLRQGNCIWIFFPLIFANLRELFWKDWREFADISGFPNEKLYFGCRNFLMRLPWPYAFCRADAEITEENLLFFLALP